MQAFVNMVAMVATVVHLTVGCCCTHPGHTQAGDDSCHKMVEVASTGCHHHSHAHQRAPDQSESDHCKVSDGHSHQCSGCYCVTTVSAKVVPGPTGMQLVAIVANLDDLMLSRKTAVADRIVPDPFAYAGLRPHSIFERFLI